VGRQDVDQKVLFVQRGHHLAVLELGAGHVARNHVVEQHLGEERLVGQKVGQDAGRQLLKRKVGGRKHGLFG
jgi:hypothetical protein